MTRAGGQDSGDWTAAASPGGPPKFYPTHIPESIYSPDISTREGLLLSLIC